MSGTEDPGPETTRPSLRQREGAPRYVMTPGEWVPYTAWGCHSCSAGEEGGLPKEAAARAHGEQTGHDVFVVEGRSRALHAGPSAAAEEDG